MRDDDVQSVGSATLKDNHQTLGSGGCAAFFADASVCAVICAKIESWVCFDTSDASSFVSMAESAIVASSGGGPPANCVASTFTPLTLPLVSARAKFMRLSS